MTISRNGISGLALRAAIIGLAAVMFGCAPRGAAGIETAAPIAAAAMQSG